ncbi:MAG: hypothetical protein ACI9YO_000161 [Gammaproteobacteria bacterium]
MNIKQLKLAALTISISMFVSACATFGKADDRWVDYQSWTKITEGQVSTGDPTGFVGNVHAGPKGYRDIFINDIGITTNQGTGPYKYPIGTVIVKEQYKNKAKWEAQDSPGITIMIKVATSDTPSADNWRWSAGLTDTPEKNAFCSGCHTIALANDFNFTHEDFFKTQ